MQKTGRIHDFNRRKSANQPMPGFPITNPFADLSEAIHYVSNEEITCLLCGRPSKLLSSHTYKAHGIRSDYYRKMYNIPPHLSLAGKHFRETHIMSGKRDSNINRLALLLPIAHAKRAERLIKKGPSPSQVQASKINIVKAKNNNLPKSAIFSNFDWHLEQVKLFKDFNRVPPPCGEAKWRTYTNRRKKDLILNEMHFSAKNTIGRRYTQELITNWKEKASARWESKRNMKLES
jgi:hypothetical protein